MRKKQNKLKFFTRKKLGIISIIGLIMVTLLIVTTFCDLIFCPYPAIVMVYKYRYDQMAELTYLEQLKIYTKDTLYDSIEGLNYSQLLKWEHRHLTYWSGELQVRPEMPIEILTTNLLGTLLVKDFTFRIAVYCNQTGSYTIYLNDGETTNDVIPYSWRWSGYALGRCGEFALLYNGLLLANGYRSRIVVDCSIETNDRITGDHVWNEVWINSTWVHIDPTESIINSPDMYSNPDKWNKNVNLVYSIEGNEIIDLTNKYR
jgi:hypothetical protein